MNISDALLYLSQSDVVIGMDREGTVKMIKNGNSNDMITCLSDVFDILWKLFNQETEIEYFNEAFQKEFNALLLKHLKRFKFENKQSVSAEEELRVTTWCNDNSNCA